MIACNTVLLLIIKSKSINTKRSIVEIRWTIYLVLLQVRQVTLGQDSYMAWMGSPSNRVAMAFFLLIRLVYGLETPLCPGRYDA